MSRINGKRPTINQMKVFEREYPNLDVNEYLYAGEESIDDAGNKRTSKLCPKHKYMKFVHRITGEIIKASI